MSRGHIVQWDMHMVFFLQIDAQKVRHEERERSQALDSELVDLPALTPRIDVNMETRAQNLI